MQRRISVALGAAEIELVATFRASVDVAEKVADPLHIAREAALEGMMLAAGTPYQPRFAFTVTNVPLLLHVGQRAAGGTRSLEEMQELVFDAGFHVARDAAIRYIALLVSPQSEEALGGKGGTAPGE